jgi:hypothetical protein
MSTMNPSMNTSRVAGQPVGISLSCLLITIAAMLLSGRFGCSPSHAQSCVPCYVDSRVVSTNASKCGFPEYVVSSPPRFYLRQVTDREYTRDDHGVQAGWQSTKVEIMDDGLAGHSDFNNCSVGWAPITATYSGDAYLAGEGGCQDSQLPSGMWDPGDCESFVWRLGFDYVTFLWDDPLPTFQRGTYSDGIGIEAEMTLTLEDEYTDAMLHSRLISRMPAWGAWQPDFGSVFFDRTEDHVCVQGARMQYRFRVPHTEKDTTYRIDWQRITTYPDGSIELGFPSLEFEGTGGPWQSDPRIEEVPTTPSTVTMANVTITIVDAGTGGGASGSPGHGTFGGTGDGCEACLGESGVAGGSGVDLRLSLGSAQFGRSAGFLSLGGSKPHPALATRGAVLLTSGRPGTEVEAIAVTGSLDQVLSPQALAHLIDITPYKYEIQFYLRSQVGTNVGGLYQVSGSPFVTWTIENPDASPTVYDRLRITETRDSGSKVHDYVYSAGTESWLFTQPGNLREIELIAITEGASSRSQEIILRKPGGPDIHRVYRKFQQFAWGEALIQMSEGDPADAHLTHYTYYASPPFAPNGTALPVETVTHPDGSWERFQYDSQGRVTLRLSSWLDQAPTWNTNDCRSITYNYTPLSGSGDDGSQPDTPRTVIEWVLGQETGRSYTVVKPGERREIRCQTPGAAWTDSSNIETITKRFTSSTHQGRIQEILHPDGTKTLYNYSESGGTFTTTVDRGEPSGGAIKEGTRSVTVLGPVGELLSRTTRVLSNSIPTVVLSEETYTYTDALKRSHEVVHLNGRTNIVIHACCGLDTEIDWDGTPTSYDYDALGRQTSTLRHGITHTNILDAAGRVLVRQRIGTDLSVHTLEQFAYDTAGRVTHHTNALGGVTTYTEALVNNKRQRTITNLTDGGQRVEIYYRDGRLEKVTGSAAFPVRYDYNRDLLDSAYREYTLETKLTLPDGATTTNEYHLTGLLKKTWGARQYPVEYGYDAQGRMTNMVTWQSFNLLTGSGASPATNTWQYETNRGWLRLKGYPNASSGVATTNGPVYSYTAAGRLQSRVWQRGVTTTYAYNTGGDLWRSTTATTRPG